MRKIFEILTHKLVFINRTSLQLCLFFILQAPLIFSLVYTLLNYERFLNESLFRYISIGYIITSIWIFYKSIDSKIISRAKDNFEFQKYINCSADFYKAISKKEQRRIYDSIIKDITKKGLKFSSSKTNYNSVQKDFINLVNSENFKQRVLYTLDFERFTDIINLLNGKTWIRETFRYKNEFRNSINITLSKLVKQQEKVSLEEISNIIINNINISENGVILIEKELRTEIDIILVKNKTLKEKTTASNQANEVEYSKKISSEQKQLLLSFLTPYFREYTQQNLEYLIDLNFSSIQKPLKLRKSNRSFSLLYLKLLEVDIYSREEVDSIFDSKKIIPKTAKTENFTRKAFANYMDVYNNNSKSIIITDEYKKISTLIQSL